MKPLANTKHFYFLSQLTIIQSLPKPSPFPSPATPLTKTATIIRFLLVLCPIRCYSHNKILLADYNRRMRTNTTAASSSPNFKEFGRFSGRLPSGRLPTVLEERSAGQRGTFAGEDMDKVAKKGVDQLQLPLNRCQEASQTVLAHPRQLLAHTLSSNNLQARKVFPFPTPTPQQLHSFTDRGFFPHKTLKTEANEAHESSGEKPNAAMGPRAKRRTHNDLQVKNSPAFLQGRKGKENQSTNLGRKNEGRAEISSDNRSELPFNLTINAPPKTNYHSNTPSHVFKGAGTGSCRLKTHSMNATSPSCTYFLLRRPSKPTPKLKLADFQVGVCKGSGRFGKVFQAIHLQTGLLVAIKQISKALLRPILPQFINQLRIHLLMAHPNLVKLFGFFDDAENVFLLMEYMEEGSLYSRLMRKGKLGETESGQILGEICQGVAYLHSREVLHRDIKPQNIVLSYGVSKLCDFGWAICSSERRSTYCGTLDYACPEMLEGGSYNSEIDVWAIGVLAYELLTGRPPFYHSSRQVTIRNIRKGDLEMPKGLSLNAQVFLGKTLERKASERVGMGLLLADRFVQEWIYRG